MKTTPNKNCLEGMACPKCQATGPFKIEVSALAMLTDDGVNETLDYEWDDDSFCECAPCAYHATVNAFFIRNQNAK